jgi:D-alanyl-D-alanine carboxypeptidase
MPIDKIAGTKIPKWAKRDGDSGIKFDTATYMGVVKDNRDPRRLGRLRVWIPEFGLGDQGVESSWQTVNYASPFFGATFVGDQTTNNKFETTNHTYGMWMVPPDVGNQVLCTFVNGDPDRGYWFACVNPTVSHYMVPALAGAKKTDTELASADLKSSLVTDGTQVLPVAEYNENRDDAFAADSYNNARPIHEFQANVLFQQGLDRDAVRGAVSSNSHRESPSHVFGISTPGRALGNDPADDPAYEKKLADGSINILDYEVKARKGGHTFVMDDGDVNGKDQLVRLRSSAGHQILMNDTEGIMFIINSTGSSWIELSKNGDMNIYNGGSFSVRAQGDINLRADKNINIEAGSALNLKGATYVNAVSADINISATSATNVFGAKTNVGASGALTLGGGTIAVGSGGALELKGGTVAIDTGGANNAGAAVSLQTQKFPDTSYDPKTRLWNSVADQAASIVSIFPAHQPWIKSSTPGAGTEAPIQVLPVSVCPPRTTASPGDYVLPKPNGNKLDLGRVHGGAYGSVPWSTDTAFLDKTKQVAANLGIGNWLWLLAAMYLETGGTMDPAEPNRFGFYGLIQFGGDARKLVGYNPSDIPAFTGLSRVQQLDLVEKYFKLNPPWKKSKGRMVDVYSCINWPVATGEDLTYIVYGKNGSPPGATYTKFQNKAYDQNHFDKTGKNYVTVQDFETFMQTRLDAVKQCLANAGTAVAPGTLQSSSGIAVTDSSGKPIASGSKTTSANVDVGINNAYGRTVSSSCPKDWLGKPELYKSPTAISSTAPLLTQEYATNMHAELGYFESQWDYASTGGTTSTPAGAAINIGTKGTILVMGDSIAWGTGRALATKLSATSVMAEVGDNSTTILANAKNPPAPASGTKGTYQQYQYENDWVGKVKVAVISCGSNDIVKGVGNKTLLIANLKAIRAALRAEKYIWILPYDSIACDAVTQVASITGDKTIALTDYPSGDSPPLHPSSYPNVAKSLQALITSITSGSTSTTASTTGDGTRIGKYQVDAYLLAEAGYIKPDAIKQYGAQTLSKNESWTGKDSIRSQKDFFANKQLQDDLQNKEFLANYKTLVTNKGIKPEDDICMAAGMLFVAHKYRSPQLAAEWRQSGKVKTPPTVAGEAGSAEEYFNHGRYAIDVLSAQAITGTSNAAGPIDLSIDPDTVMEFKASGTGTRARFDASTPVLRSATLQLAKAYKEKTGKKLPVNSTLRTNEEQAGLYNAWVAGGNKGNSVAPPGTSQHNLGQAMDVNLNVYELDTAMSLAKFNLKTIPNDSPHMQVINTKVTDGGNSSTTSGTGDQLVVLITGLESAGEPAKTGVKNLSASLNSSGVTANVFSCNDIAGASAYVAANRGTKKLVLIGFSAGAAVVNKMAENGIKVDLMICIDGWWTVTLVTLPNLSKNVTRAINYYNPGLFPGEAGYPGNPNPASNPRVTHIINSTNHYGIVAAVSGNVISDVRSA